MKRRFLKIVSGVIFIVCIGLPDGGGMEDRGDVEILIMMHRHRGEPSLADDLQAYAKAKGFSDGEMALRLVELVQAAFNEDMDEEEHAIADGAICGLLPFGGEKESAFLLDVLRKTEDGHIRLSAIMVGMRLSPSNWEEWLAEVCGGTRCGMLERYVAYREVFRIGKDSGGEVRRRVGNVFAELAGKEEDRGNHDHLLRWADELLKCNPGDREAQEQGPPN